MAHFAKLNDNNIVVDIHVINNDVITIDGVESEQAGIDFLKELFGDGNWKQTSYNGNFRKHYAAIGFTYDVERDAFIPQKPFNSWSLNEDTCVWEPPVPYPNDGKKYAWYEINKEWVETKIPS